mgnify:CR=1 FL=1
MADAKRDANYITTLLGVSNVDGTTPVVLWADPTTHRLLVSLAGITVETPTGTVNASNVSFTVTAEPKWVVADGATYFAGAGYSYAALTVTMDLAPSIYIRSIY